MSVTYTHEKLYGQLLDEYHERFPLSGKAHGQAKTTLIDGISHGARLMEPFPFRIQSALGASVTDLDGHKLVDFWQGHYANILGHNPTIIRDALSQSLNRGVGLQTGIPDETQTRYAETLAKAMGADRVRLTTAGTLATMYALMLARAHTGRKLVVKVAGGWHGANPLALKGVQRDEDGFDHVDSAGVSNTTDQEIIVTRFNDVEQLERLFACKGDQIACFIFEPCPSVAGFIPATAEYVRTARDLTQKHGALLIQDEVITGFRYCASGIHKLYGIQPDLTTMGKVIGGGMPISAVAGRNDVMSLASETNEDRVWFNGGTFCAHPLALVAGQTMLNYLTANEDTLYPALAERGQKLRTGVEKVFADRGIVARCTGHSAEGLFGSSVGGVYFPHREDLTPTSAEDITDPSLCDVNLRERTFRLALVLEGVHIIHGLGALSTSHDDEDMDKVFAACDSFAKKLLAAN